MKRLCYPRRTLSVLLWVVLVLSGCRTTRPKPSPPVVVAPQPPPQPPRPRPEPRPPAKPRPRPRPRLRLNPAQASRYPALPSLVASLMPLKGWLTRVPVDVSLPLPPCRRRLMRYAYRSLGRSRNVCTAAAARARYRNNCSGWVRCVYSRLGIDVFKPRGYRGRGGAVALWHYFYQKGRLHQGRPRSGDVVFWHGTVDRNRNGHLNDDPLTHVGIVEGIDPDGRVRIFHTGYRSRSGVHRIFMYRPKPALWRIRRPRRHQTTRTVLPWPPFWTVLSSSSLPSSSAGTLFTSATAPLSSRSLSSSHHLSRQSRKWISRRKKRSYRYRCRREIRLHHKCMKIVRRYRRGSRRRRHQLWRCLWRKKRIRRFCRRLRGWRRYQRSITQGRSRRRRPTPVPPRHREKSPVTPPTRRTAEGPAPPPSDHSIPPRRRTPQLRPRPYQPRPYQPRRYSKYKVYNSYLVSKRSRKSPHLGHTTAELFAGYGTLNRCPLP